MFVIKSEILEIERKYSSYKGEWGIFIDLVRSKSPHRELEVDGPDTYYQKDNVILRWRMGPDISELTIKSRYSLSTSLIREESEISLSNNKPRHVMTFLNRLGFKKLFRIRKNCHMFWIKNDIGVACIVIYKVSSRNQEEKYFIEIEAKKGLSIAESKELIRYWEKELNLPTHRRMNQTLFEIYSGQITRLVD